MNKTNVFATAVLAMTLAGCASNDANQANNSNITNMPEWVMNPVSANGFAASNCVESSGNFSIDRNHAISLTRNTLAQNMQLKASVLEKSYQKMESASGMTTSGTSFEQVAKQVTSVSLTKSQVEKVAIVNIAGKDQVCALVTIPKVEAEQQFKAAMMKVPGMNPMTQDHLYKEFVSQKTAKELEAQVKSLSSEQAVSAVQNMSAEG